MRRPRLKPIRERNPVAVALVGLVLLGLVGALAYRADSLPFLGGGTTYSADFSEAAGLRSGDEVRVAGVKVGEVTGVGLDGAKVKVDFKVEDVWIGDESTAGIAIQTLLGEKYLAVDPLGSSPQDPDQRIPHRRTTSPYDVTEAFQGLSRTVDDLDTEALEDSFRVLSETFADTPPDVEAAATGLADLSKTISSRDAELDRLLKGGNRLTETIADQNERFETLLTDGNKLLDELRKRRDAINALLTGTRDLGRELTGLVEDNEKQLAPTLASLSRVVAVLKKNVGYLDRALAAAGPYYRLVNNSLGNGRWFDSYLCGVVPKDYLPPGTPPATGCMPPKQRGGR